jgi:hypothetical protein
MDKGYWIICVNSYVIDGKEISRGHMQFHTSIRPVINSNWRRATLKEIKGIKWFKGISYYHEETEQKTAGNR